jgi:hypothetical protein
MFTRIYTIKMKYNTNHPLDGFASPSLLSSEQKRVAHSEHRDIEKQKANVVCDSYIILK